MLGDGNHGDDAAAGGGAEGGDQEMAMVDMGAVAESGDPSARRTSTSPELMEELNRRVHHYWFNNYHYLNIFKHCEWVFLNVIIWLWFVTIVIIIIGIHIIMKILHL